jgi:redox-sensitive bicupin YhaK (pirin superfamily)
VITQVVRGREADVGGLAVRRVLPFRERRMVGPFVFLDHGGPLALEGPVPRAMDVKPHPHIGLSTLTYLFEGELTHRDSTGVEQPIRPGEVNWMTAGSGVSHSERFEDPFRRAGGTLSLLQAWVALPEAEEERDPSFHHFGRAAIPAFDEPGFRARLVAGAAYGATSPVPAHSPLFYVHVDLAPDGCVGVPRDYPERGCYVVAGRVEIAGGAYEPGDLVIFAPGAAPLVTALGPATVVLLGGEPLGPRHIWWNFVSSRKERIEQAKADWRAGRIALPVHDDREWVPLPGDPAPPAEPLS